MTRDSGNRQPATGNRSGSRLQAPSTDIRYSSFVIQY